MNLGTDLSITIHLLSRVLPFCIARLAVVGLSPCQWEFEPVQHWCHTWSTSEAQHCLNRIAHCAGVTHATKIEKKLPSFEVFENLVTYYNRNAFGDWGGCLLAKKTPFTHIMEYRGMQKTAICCFAFHMSGRMTGPFETNRSFSLLDRFSKRTPCALAQQIHSSTA